MRVFLTGATGYIGRGVARALRQAGHSVKGLARSDKAATKLELDGVAFLRGNLRDADLLATASQEADGVVHAGMEWGPDTGAVDRAAVEAILAGRKGSGKPFIYTSGTWLMGSTGDAVADEQATLSPPSIVAWRPAVERLAIEAGGIVIRPTMVYGRGGGAIADFVKSASEHGVVRYVGTGENRWSFIHIDALARLYVLALEKGVAGEKFVVSNGPALKVRDVAETVARSRGGDVRAESWPASEAAQTLGSMVDGLMLDQNIASDKARQQLGWEAACLSVMDEISSGSYR